jgi:hypothetical protein
MRRTNPLANPELDRFTGFLLSPAASVGHKVARIDGRVYLLLICSHCKSQGADPHRLLRAGRVALCEWHFLVVEDSVFVETSEIPTKPISWSTHQPRTTVNVDRAPYRRVIVPPSDAMVRSTTGRAANHTATITATEPRNTQNPIQLTSSRLAYMWLRLRSAPVRNTSTT